MLNEILNSMKSEFGFLKEDGQFTAIDNEIEKEVIGKLQKSAKLDEIDTVTFGLETDDNKIIKVYVKADQAENFEKALAEKLGECDDIQEALNQLSKDFEIVDVDWPDADDTESKEEEEDDDDGSDAMNKKVYHNKDLTEGEKFTMNLQEDLNSLESRFTSASQLMVYHAILDLGIPEISLIRNPYRASIIHGIKEKALELNNNSSMKVALRSFLKRSTDYEKEAEKNADAETKNPVKESLVLENVVIDFWTGVSALINYAAGDSMSASNLIESSKYRQLVQRSTSSVTGNFTSSVKMKMMDLIKAVEADDFTNALKESINVDELSKILESLFKLADPTENFVNAIMQSTAFNQYVNKARAKLSQKFNGNIRTKLNTLKLALQIVESVEVQKPIVESDSKWTFERQDSLNVISSNSIKMSITDEELEKVLKGITNRDAVVVKDTEAEKKFSFSPRATGVYVKESGNSKSHLLSGKQLEEFMNYVKDQFDKND